MTQNGLKWILNTTLYNGVPYPFDCSKAFFSKANDVDHRKGEANGEEEEIVAKVIWSCPGWATAKIR